MYVRVCACLLRFVCLRVYVCVCVCVCVCVSGMCVGIYACQLWVSRVRVDLSVLMSVGMWCCCICVHLV